MDKSKFDFYEIVRVITKDKEYSDEYGKEGVVLGKAQNDDGTWGYSVNIFEIGYSVAVEEDQIESLGRFSKRENHFIGESVKVYVDEDGKGFLKNEDDE